MSVNIRLSLCVSLSGCEMIVTDERSIICHIQSARGVLKRHENGPLGTVYQNGFISWGFLVNLLVKF